MRGQVLAWHGLPTHFSELFDLGEVVADDLGMLMLKVLGKLGNVVHLDLVPQPRLFLEPWAQSADSTWGLKRKNGIHTHVGPRERIH